MIIVKYNIYIEGRGKTSRKIKYFFLKKKIKNFFEMKNNKSETEYIIIFSNVKNTLKILKKTKNKSIIIGTTGFKKKDIETMKKMSKKNKIFFSSNFNIELYKIIKITEGLCINKIIDIHKKNKTDSPSGTSIIISNILNIKNRDSIKLRKNMGIHVLKTKNKNNKVKISHKNKNIKDFILGILKTLFFLKNKKEGLYSIGNLLYEGL